MKPPEKFEGDITIWWNWTRSRKQTLLFFFKSGTTPKKLGNTCPCVVQYDSNTPSTVTVSENTRRSSGVCGDSGDKQTHVVLMKTVEPIGRSDFMLNE